MATARTNMAGNTRRASRSRQKIETLPAITNETIARRAFELYCERGSQHGHDVEDWLRAERELRVPPGSSSTVAPSLTRMRV
jgi:hypothetical protein